MVSGGDGEIRATVEKEPSAISSLFRVARENNVFGLMISLRFDP
jgi:hypothetical protein